LPPKQAFARDFNSVLFGLVACSPVDYLCFLSSRNLVFWIRLLRLAPLINLRSMFDTLLDKCEAWWQALPRQLLGIMRNFLEVCLFAHVAACVWFKLGHWEDSNDSWINSSQKKYVEAARCFGNIDESTHTCGPDDYHISKLYFASLYYVFETMSMVGYGEPIVIALSI
jgi:hypothetical protein